MFLVRGGASAPGVGGVPVTRLSVARGVYDAGIQALSVVKCLQDALDGCRARLVARVSGAAEVEAAALDLDRWQGGVAASSAATEIAMALGIPELTAAALEHHATALVRGHPEVLAALEGGEVSWRHATIIHDELSTLHETPGTTAVEAAVLEARLLELAQNTTASSFAGKARRAREKMHPETITTRTRDAFTRRKMACDAGTDGMSWLSLHLPTVSASAIYTRCTRLARAVKAEAAAAQHAADLAGTGEDCAEHRTLAQLRADIAAILLLGQDLPTTNNTDNTTDHGADNGADSGDGSGADRGAGAASGTVPVPDTGTGRGAGAGAGAPRGGRNEAPRGARSSSPGAGDPAAKTGSTRCGPGPQAGAASGTGPVPDTGAGDPAAKTGSTGCGPGPRAGADRGASDTAGAGAGLDVPFGQASAFGVTVVQHARLQGLPWDMPQPPAATGAAPAPWDVPKPPAAPPAAPPAGLPAGLPAAPPAGAPAGAPSVVPGFAGVASSPGPEDVVVGELVGDGSGYVDGLVDGIREDPEADYRRQLAALARSKVMVDPPLPEALVIVTVPFLGLLGITDEPGELAGPQGGPVPEEVARKLLGNASSFLRVLTDPITGEALPLEPQRYTLRASEKAVLQALAGGCYVPNCPNPVMDTDLDHLRAFEFGGATTLANLKPACRKHHTLRHFKDDKDRHGRRRCIDEPDRNNIKIRGWTPKPTPDGRIGWTTPSGTYHPPQNTDPHRPHYPKWLKKLITKATQNHRN